MNHISVHHLLVAYMTNGKLVRNTKHTTSSDEVTECAANRYLISIDKTT